MRTTSSQRGLRWGALLLLASLPAVPAYARTHHSESWARDHFATAERMREALNGRPQADRTRRDFQRVINAYRNVYFGAPTSTKADPSVVAVAETMVEMGRRFDDDKILNQAIAQYRFLRREYPGSKFRCDALFTIGEIYKDDLNDPTQARKTFQEFLHRYPHNRLVEDAQQAVTELDREAEAEKKAEAQKKTGKETAEKKSSRDGAGKDSDAEADNNAQEPAERPSDNHSGRRLPRVTGIRHWSTPDYTRVAIDLENEVKFGSQRIDNPDRIFFDLRDTKLASTLVGKSFDVDDGFLKKIRVAQFQPGRTRVVLEVDNLSDYNAFLLPNPYRLIIDIHGKDTRSKTAQTKSPTDTPLAAADVEAGPKAGLKPEGTASVAENDVAGAETQDRDEDGHADSPRTHAEIANKTADKVRPASTSEAAARSRLSNAAQRRCAQDSQNRDSAGCGGVRTVIDRKTGVKKVIVDADDDDSDPVQSAATQVAKVEGTEIERKKLDQTEIDPTRIDPTKLDETRANSPAGMPTLAEDDSGAGTGPTAEGVKTIPDAHDGDARSKHSAASSGKISASRQAQGERSRAKGARKTGHSATDKGATVKATNDTADLDIHEARPTAGGDRSLIRALGLKIGKIVIDPGHGGHDTGTIGPDGLEEKDLVLEVGRRLGRLLETRLGAEVVYTRKDDTFIPLETRTAIANQQRADLFISIHANSSDDPAARGVETYYLNFTSSPDALEVAARENAVSEKSIYELQDLVKKIALKEKIEESREFAGDVQQSLHSGLAAKNPGIRDRGVKKAPFIVLIGANMPSILAEISFVSNPGDEHRLETAEYRQRIAESLYRGIAKYVNGLSGVKVASNRDKAAGQ